jgi:hypothetical protein
MTNRTNDPKVLDSLIEELSRYRGVLVAGYLVLLALFVGVVWYASISGLPELLPKLAGLYNEFRRDRYPDYVADAAVVGGFFLLQALFVWGGGRVQVSRGPVKLRKLAISLLITSSWMALLGVGLTSTFAEMANRFQDDPTHRGGGLEAFFNSPKFFVLLAGSWLLWLVIGLILVRGQDQHTALSRLIGIVLVGSWVEFTIALPIDLVTRDRNKDCICASGSWLALLITIPLLLWSVGPAIYLLYRREKALQGTDHRRTLRILLGKTARKARVEE